MRSFIGALFALGIAAALLGLSTERVVSAHPAPCDFLTGGGFINTTGGGTHEIAKGTSASVAAASTACRPGAISNTTITATG